MRSNHRVAIIPDSEVRIGSESSGPTTGRGEIPGAMSTSVGGSRLRVRSAGFAMLLVVCASLVLAGCGGGKKTRSRSRAQRATPAPAPEPELVLDLEDEPEEIPYSYSPLGKRDPFEDVMVGRTVLAPPDQRRGPLQAYDLDALKVRFTVTGTSSPQAMIVTPNNRAYMVGIGDFVGKNWGKVSHIGREEVIVTETIVDPVTNGVFPVNLTMRMPRTAEEIRAEQVMEMTVEGEDFNP